MTLAVPYAMILAVTVAMHPGAERDLSEVGKWAGQEGPKRFGQLLDLEIGTVFGCNRQNPILAVCGLHHQLIVSDRDAHDVRGGDAEDVEQFAFRKSMGHRCQEGRVLLKVRHLRLSLIAAPYVLKRNELQPATGVV